MISSLLSSGYVRKGKHKVKAETKLRAKLKCPQLDAIGQTTKLKFGVELQKPKKKHAKHLPALHKLGNVTLTTNKTKTFTVPGLVHRGQWIVLLHPLDKKLNIARIDVKPTISKKVKKKLRR